MEYCVIWSAIESLRIVDMEETKNKVSQTQIIGNNKVLKRITGKKNDTGDKIGKILVIRLAAQKLYNEGCSSRYY